MNVTCVLAEIFARGFGNIGEFFVFTGSDEANIAVFLRFFVRFLAKLPVTI